MIITNWLSFRGDITYMLAIICLILYLSDGILTNYTIRMAKKYSKKKFEYDEFEVNQIACYLWNKYGLNKGGMIMILIEFFGGLLIVLFLAKDFNFVMFGILIVVNTIHIINFFYIWKNIGLNGQKAQPKQRRRIRK